MSRDGCLKKLQPQKNLYKMKQKYQVRIYYPFIIRYYPLLSVYLSVYYRLLWVSQLLIHFLGSDEEQSVSDQSNATDATDSITSGATDED